MPPSDPWIMAAACSIAHEMATPLAGIRLDAITLRVLLDSVPVAARVEMAETLARIDQHAGAAATLAEILLVNLAPRIDPTGFAVHSMTAVIEQALAFYPFHEDQRRAVRGPTGPDFVFFGHDPLMRHVLFNLLKNALRALAEARRRRTGTITLTLEPGTSLHRLTVRDTGPGIAPELLPTLFEPLCRQSRNGPRLSLGLSFCRRVVESFGGTITARSEPGVFTEFAITLPAVTAADPPPDDTATADERHLKAPLA